MHSGNKIDAEGRVEALLCCARTSTLCPPNIMRCFVSQSQSKDEPKWKSKICFFKIYSRVQNNIKNVNLFRVCLGIRR
jgi:hypothetical protein